MRGQRLRFGQEERETNSGDSATEGYDDGLELSYTRVRDSLWLKKIAE
jgi:hypothetical protein